MRKTAVCLFVILSLLSLGLTFLPTGCSQTQNIKVINYSYYFDSEGYLDVVGLVQNVGANAVNPVILTGSVFAPNRELVSQSYCQVWASYITPGQEAPFYMEFQPPQGISGRWLPSYVGNITLIVSQANATSSYLYQGLKIISSSAEIGTAAMGDNGQLAGAYLVNGEVENYGTQAATNLTVVGAFFNSTGSVVGVGYTDYLTPQVLAPGDKTTFQVAAFDLNQSLVPASLQIHSYQLLVQTQLPILQGTPPTTPPPQSSTPTPAGNRSPSSSNPGGNSKNSSINSTIYLIVIAAAILAVTVAGALMVLRRSKTHQTVKEARKAKRKVTR